MKATTEQVRNVLLELYRTGWHPQRYLPAPTPEYPGFGQVDQVPALGRQVTNALDAAGLQLGGLLRTPPGEFYARVIEQLSPPLLRVDEQLIVDILTEASRLQSEGRQREARPLAAVGAALAAVVIVYAATRGNNLNAVKNP